MKNLILLYHGVVMTMTSHDVTVSLCAPIGSVPANNVSSWTFDFAIGSRHCSSIQLVLNLVVDEAGVSLLSRRGRSKIVDRVVLRKNWVVSSSRLLALRQEGPSSCITQSPLQVNDRDRSTSSGENTEVVRLLHPSRWSLSSSYSVAVVASVCYQVSSTSSASSPSCSTTQDPERRCGSGNSTDSLTGLDRSSVCLSPLLFY